MSLLLDALKKAAQEKQLASSAGNESEKAPDKNHVELSLDEPETVEAPRPAEPIKTQPDEVELSVEPVLELEKKGATTSTVSDEALQLLVYKTNKQYRSSQKIIWGGALFAALLLLMLGGYYYYYVMIEEVEALERKHKIAMRLFDSKQVIINNKKPPVDEDRVEPTQKLIVKKTNKTMVTSPQKKRTVATSARATETFSIKRTEKRDPVSVLLNNAWRAYGVEDYVIAEDAYTQVLEREPRNRDALLGKAAIAVKLGKYAQARKHYSELLRLDPRDQIAMSALSNLDEVATDTLGESRLKFMLQQQPNATHLHFALGNYYAKQAKWPEAQSEYFSAWQGSSENADYAFNLAVSLDQLGKHDEARRFYEKSLSLSAGKNINFSIKAVKERLSSIAAR